jgi:hypothetical protein
MLAAAYRKDLVGSYKHPPVLLLFGITVTVATAAMSIYTVLKDWDKFFSF